MLVLTFIALKRKNAGLSFMTKYDELYRFNKHRLQQLIYQYGEDYFKGEIKRLKNFIKKYELKNGNTQEKS